MERFLKYLESLDIKRLDGERGEVITLDDTSTNFLHLIDCVGNVSVNVTSKESASTLIIARSQGEKGELSITIGDGARLNLLEVVCSESNGGGVVIKQMNDSLLNSTVLQFATSNINYLVNLDGHGADTELNILQLPSNDDHMVSSVKIAHNSADCTSRSTSKCAASGSSIGEFHGMVYVAQGAQRTLSQQNSRNVALSPDAKIIAEPQLEIYADDVKCSHGATVGQMNNDAILYMRQRGLSEDQARKLQLDGFVSEITNSCAIDQLRDSLSEFAREQLQRI